LSISDLRKLCDESKPIPGKWDSVTKPPPPRVEVSLPDLEKLLAVVEAAERVAAGRWVPECNATLMLVVDGPERNGLYEALAALESE
jgi:hypothetical protein